jgi:enoyl-CoA hydratase/carnithine racemase
MAVILLEKRGPLGILTLNRPEAMNALGAQGDGAAVRAVCEQANADPELRCLILTGAGRAFSAGGDVKAMLARDGAFAGGGTTLRENYRREFQMLSKAIFDLDIPLIAAVNGAAVGLGCDLACLADVRVASDQARFGVTFLKVGLIPGDGGTWLLPRVIGYSRAAELLFSGDLIDARTAAEWGLVSRVVPHADLMPHALELAQRFAAQPPHALRLCKALLRQGRSASYESMLEMSAAAQALCHLTDDHIEGVSALLEKRPPVFRGA